MFKRLEKLIFGQAKDPQDPAVYRHLTLVAFFAWVGLGADGLSSACYGPEEAFLALGTHTHLVLPLAILMVVTIATVSACYSKVVELFPTGGGGYLVAARMLGAPAGLVSGSALLLDYVLTIAISCAAGVDAIYSFLPPEWGFTKGMASAAAVILLIALNLRGVKESINVLLPVFMLFIITHIVAIVAVFIRGSAQLPTLGTDIARIQTDLAGLGFVAVAGMLLRAYALGGGTYTGIEAVSNSMQTLREPKVQTAQRTMRYMAVSLTVAAVGLLMGYLLLGIKPVEGRTMNASLLSQLGFGGAFVTVALISEGFLLLVAAQAGFVGGPRMLATMAIDAWVPRTFSRLSDRLVTQNGVLVMGGAALGFVVLTGGRVKELVVLYAIAVFITFVLTHLGLIRYGVAERKWGTLALNVLALALSGMILTTKVTVHFRAGAWMILLSVGALVLLLAAVKTHYNRVGRLLRKLDEQLLTGPPPSTPRGPELPILDSATAIVCVTSWSGIGMHAFLTIHRLFPGAFRNFVFLSVGVVDFDRFKGVSQVAALEKKTIEDLDRYVEAARAYGFYAARRHAVGTDPIDELEELVARTANEFPRATVFGGQLVFPEEGLLTRLLHQQSTFALQRRLHLRSIPMMILPVRVIR